MGSLAAILTSICWSWSAIFFSNAGYIVGSKVVNRTRLLFAVTFLAATHLIVTGSILPIHVEGFRWLWLGLSGFIGLVLGDAMLFQAYVYVGPRIAMLVMSIVPAISAVLAWLFLGEVLDVAQIFGISLTMSGIMLVVSDRTSSRKVQIPGKTSQHWLGILLSIGGAFGQAIGLIFAKMGLVGNFPALSGVMMRMVVAAVIIWVVAFLSKEVKLNFDLLKKNPATIKHIFSGAFVGPFLGVWLSMIAVQNTKVGISSTLMALTPIIHLPIARYYLHEEINLRAIIGTIVAIAGIAIIFLVPSF